MILCGPCHTRYEVEAMHIKSMLAKKYDAPVNGKGWYYDSELGKVKKAAKALLSSSITTIPSFRIDELKQLVRTHFGLPPAHTLTEEELQAALNIEPLVRTPDFMSHGAAVVAQLNSPEALTEFIQMWRRHFVGTMQPQFIHPSWGIARGKSELRQPLDDALAASSSSPTTNTTNPEERSTTVTNTEATQPSGGSPATPRSS